MVQGFRIETLDRSGRWYLAPGTRSIYDLRVRNDSKSPTECTLVIEDPTAGVSAEPSSFTLRGYEVRTVTLTFSEDVNPARTSRILAFLRDASGGELAKFEHPLVVTGGTDCSIGLAFKEPLFESDVLRGFVMSCAVRSQAEAPASFPVAVTGHPSLSVPEVGPLQLEPGQGGEVTIAIRWDQSVKDQAGFNHPPMLEVSVPVSNGKRTSRFRWELIDEKLRTVAANSASAARAPTAVVANATPPSPPAPAAASATLAPSPAALNGSVPATPQLTPSKVSTPTLVPIAVALARFNELKCLPNPSPVQATSALNGVARAAQPLNGAATAVATADVVELPLFADLPSPGKVSSPGANGTTNPKADAPAPATQNAAPASAQPETAPLPATNGAPQAFVAPPPAPTGTAAAQASVVAPATPTAPAQAPSVSSAQPAPAAATPAAAPVAPAAQSASVTSPPPRLTPYTPSRHDFANEAAITMSTIPTVTKAAEVPEAEKPATTPSAPIVYRARPIIPRAKRSIPTGVLIGAIAVPVLAVAVVLFKAALTPHVAQPLQPAAAVTSAAAVTAPTVVYHAPVKTLRNAPVVVHAKPKVVAAVSTPKPTVQAAPTTTPPPATPRPTARPAAAKTVSTQPVAHRSAPAWGGTPVRRQRLYQPESGPVVALGGVAAYYGPRGHVVRVYWSAAEQASADVQLIDDHGTTVSATSVRGSRQSAILYLPRRFRGSLTVQVSSIGRLGERVAETTSLPAFGY